MLNVIGVVSLLLFVIADPLSILAQGTIPPVLDTTGQPLQAGTQYYILPASTHNGGGVTLVNRNASCPFFVGQEDRIGSTGLPVIFTPSLATETVIGESRDFRIRFNASTICVQSTEWALESNPASTQRTLITTGAGNRAGVSLQIDRNGSGYKLGFCPECRPPRPPRVCPKPRCGDVGVYVENGRRLLALYAPALPVVFRKA
ncbi:hypothetical protein IFM89_026267 [Coptis chinensis]|uniref:Uncharacterized protein n=1 Tax=Coptis chinensis TaxID=261450 RepID=A0A835LZQ6_9MAGN|nr:hypothetical protein IFM89_026267 [Coptis chinensis]